MKALKTLSKGWGKWSMCCLMAISLSFGGGALAQNAAAEVEEDVIVTGVRGKPRTVADSPVPIDVFSASDMEEVAFNDTVDVLKTLVPSITVGRAAVANGDTFIRSPRLRDLPSDKTLVLVNSKRRHRAALVQLGGSGNQGADLATIPGIAVGRVEVLRDGAAAQYGSDAIAGVLNFILKDASDGASITVDRGKFSAGDGAGTTVQGNFGLPLGANGFVNISGEYHESDPTVRSEEYCEAWFCVDPALPDYNPNASYTDFGQFARPKGTTDPIYQSAVHSEATIGFGDVVVPWGKPNQEAKRFFVNAGYQFNADTEAYAFGNYSESETDGTFFYRYPRNGVIEQLREPDGIIYDPLNRFPGGFTPRFFGEVLDFSMLGGIRGAFGNNFTYDFSARLGESEIKYTLANTLNPSQGRASKRSFKPGELINEEVQFQADFTYEFDTGLASPLLLAFGASFMDESYESIANDPDSYEAGPYAQSDPHGLCDATERGGSARKLTAINEIRGRLPTKAGRDVIEGGSTLNCAAVAGDEHERGNEKYQTKIKVLAVDENNNVIKDAKGKPVILKDAAGKDVTELVDTDPVYNVVGVGSNGFPGTPEQFVGIYERRSFALYVDLSADITDRLFLQAAIRHEDYDDFDAETVWKLAGKFNVTEIFGIRASAGTGFRAPTPGQQNTTSVQTEVLDGVPSALGIFPANSPIGRALGASPLKPELSTNITLGFTLDVAELSLTLDFYRIDLEDTFYVSPRDPVSSDPSSGTSFDNFKKLQAAGFLGANTIRGAQYFANGFDTRNEGIDLVGTYPIEWAAGTTNLSLSTTISKKSVLSDSEGLLSRQAEEDFAGVNYRRSVFTARHLVGDLTLVGRLSYYGSLQRGQRERAQHFAPIWFTDLEAQYQLNDVFKITAGGRNIFGEYPERDTSRCCGQIYASAIVDWQGAYYFTRLTASF